MATASTTAICVLCNKERITYLCCGCSKNYCLHHLTEHRKDLNKQLDQIGNDHDELRQNLNDQKVDPTKHPLIKQIDQWEKDSIHRIKQIADQCREKLINCPNVFALATEEELNHLAERIQKMRYDDEFNEIDLDHLTQRLQKLQEEFVRPPNVSIVQQSTSLINSISVLIPFSKDTRWRQRGMTIAGGNGQGDRLNQLHNPSGVAVGDDNQTIYIADYGNARIVEWKANAINGRVVAGGNRLGNQNNQLRYPRNVIIDEENHSLIIADQGNRRVMRWSPETSSYRELMISNIACHGLAMHKDGSLYVSDCEKNEVRRWKKGKTNGTIVAGGNGEGDRLNQLHNPTDIFVDDNHTLYISDRNNHRVMKWVKDDKEGMIVAGGNGKGDRAIQLSFPHGVIVDQCGQIYVSDWGNHRVMRWCEGAQEGMIVVGSNEDGEQANQLHWPTSLSFDEEGNLYVADWGNHRIQKFVIDL